MHGLPRLGPRRGSSSHPTENTEHHPASLQVQEFRPLHGLQLQPHLSAIWASAKSQGRMLSAWATESDVQGFVKIVLQDAIEAAGLSQRLTCYNEMSIFKLRPDIWVVTNDRGVPVGVCEVKKPGRSIMDSRVLHGQIYDYVRSSARSHTSAPLQRTSAYAAAWC